MLEKAVNEEQYKTTHDEHDRNIHRSAHDRINIVVQKLTQDESRDYRTTQLEEELAELLARAARPMLDE